MFENTQTVIHVNKSSCDRLYSTHRKHKQQKMRSSSFAKESSSYARQFLCPLTITFGDKILSLLVEAVAAHLTVKFLSPSEKFPLPLLDLPACFFLIRQMQSFLESRREKFCQLLIPCWWLAGIEGSPSRSLVRLFPGHIFVVMSP